MSINLAGKTLKEHYYLEKQLDSGGFGTIYLARDTFSAIGGNYVVKHFSPQYNNSAQLSTAMRLFRQESNSLQKLGNHPQIPRIYDFFESDNNFYLVQELIEGQTLEQEFAQVKHFDRDRAFNLLTDVLEVLTFVHFSGYIHRDIKPSNLIRNRFNNKIFLIDFGAVKEKINSLNINERGEFVSTVGILSPGYTPDEQFHGKPDYCSDLYALGMVAIQAMTGEHPNDLQRNNNLELIWRDRLLPHYDYDLTFLTLIDRLVEQKWQNRYQSASAVLQDLLEIDSGFKTTRTSYNKTDIRAVENIIPHPTFLGRSPFSAKSNKSKIIAGLSVFSAIALASWLYFINSRKQNLITYENKDIRVEYPASWSREARSNFLNTSVVFVSPKENESDLFQERVAIIVEESSRPLSLKQYSSYAVEQIEQLTNFILSPPRPTALGHSDGKYVIYQGMDRKRKVKRKEVWTVNYKQIYTVIYTAEPDKFDRFLPQANKIIDSLEILE